MKGYVNKLGLVDIAWVAGQCVLVAMEPNDASKRHSTDLSSSIGRLRGRTRCNPRRAFCVMVDVEYAIAPSVDSRLQPPQKLEDS